MFGKLFNKKIFFLIAFKFENFIAIILYFHLLIKYYYSIFNLFFKKKKKNRKKNLYVIFVVYTLSMQKYLLSNDTFAVTRILSCLYIS